MRREKIWKKILAATVSASMVLGSLGLQWEFGKRDYVTEAATTGLEANADKRIRVDINRDDGRNEAHSTIFDNWNIPTTAAESFTTTIKDVTFTLSDGGTSGEGKVTAGNDRSMIKTDLSTPTLIMDGVYIDGGDNGGIVKLEISGLSAGKHTFKSWHGHGAGTYGAMSVEINGNVIATGKDWTWGQAENADSVVAYGEFTVEKGETVVVLVKPEKSYLGSAELSAFEIDGANPATSIKNPVPAEGNTHYEQEGGLSWTGAAAATGHAVYLGTSFESVYNATPESEEFKGIQTTTKYAFEEELSTYETYYWRVDEYSANGVSKGDVMWFQTARLAFPSAEGYGRYARGGRGGKVVEVTNLNDSGPGSLRYAVEEVSGPRTVVFRVGGVIQLKSKLIITDGDIYIAGQTAPGDGITVTHWGFGMYSAEDVIMRHVRVRPGDGDGTRGDSLEMDGIGMANCDHSIVDHCSISWTTDEGHSSRGAHNITFQYNIIAEALNAAGHYNGGRHAYAGSISGTKGSYHHNLLVNNTGRNWSMAGNLEQDKITYAGYLDIRNNVVYNFKDRTTDGGVRQVNFVGNYYKMGACSRDMKIFTIDGDQITDGNDMQRAYVSGNMLVKKDGTVLLDKDENAWDEGRASAGSYADTSEVRVDTPFFESYVTTQTADEAYETVLESAGATMPQRDYLDTRYVKETKEGTYTYKGSVDGIKGIIDSQNDVGGYPQLEGGAALKDTDHDGMPNNWEVEHGLNPLDPEDRNGLELSPEGYTNLEMYLNELAGDTMLWNAYTPSVYASEEPYESYAPPSPSPSPIVPSPVVPSPVVSQEPSSEPQVSEVVSEEPSSEPSEVVSKEPSGEPQTSEVVSEEPSGKPSSEPSEVVSEEPSSEPSEVVSEKPSGEPQASEVVSEKPSGEPQASEVVSEEPSGEPQASEVVSEKPSGEPQASEVVSEEPSGEPQASEVVSQEPSDKPSEVVSEEPSGGPAPSSSTVPSETVTSQLGDVDSNGQVELPDAQQVLKAALKIVVLKEDEIKLADVNKDSKVDLKDAQLILKRALRIINTFE